MNTVKNVSWSFKLLAWISAIFNCPSIRRLALRANEEEAVYLAEVYFSHQLKTNNLFWIHRAAYIMGLQEEDEKKDAVMVTLVDWMVKHGSHGARSQSSCYGELGEICVKYYDKDRLPRFSARLHQALHECVAIEAASLKWQGERLAELFSPKAWLKIYPDATPATKEILFSMRDPWVGLAHDANDEWAADRLLVCEEIFGPGSETAKEILAAISQAENRRCLESALRSLSVQFITGLTSDWGEVFGSDGQSTYRCLSVWAELKKSPYLRELARADVFCSLWHFILVRNNFEEGGSRHISDFFVLARAYDLSDPESKGEVEELFFRCLANFAESSSRVKILQHFAKLARPELSFAEKVNRIYSGRR